MSDDCNKKSSIWDGLPEDWASDEPVATPKAKPEEKPEKQPQKQPEKPAVKEQTGSSGGSAGESGSGGAQGKGAENNAAGSKKKKKRAAPPGKEKVNREKYREFEKRHKENRDNSSKKAREAYQKEKKENRNDFIVLGVAVLLVIAGIAVFVILFTGTSDQKIYDLIDERNYSTAYHSIEERYEKGKNVDSLVYYFADSCVDNEEYKRAVAALDMLSEDAVNHSEFFSELVEKLIAHNKPNRAAEVVEFMYERGGALSEKADELLEKNDNI